MMDGAFLFQRLCFLGVRRMMVIIGFGVIAIIVFQCFVLPYGKGLAPSPADLGPIVMLISNSTFFETLETHKIPVLRTVANDNYSSDLEEELDGESATEATSIDYTGNENKFMLNMDIAHGKNSMIGYKMSTEDGPTRARHIKVRRDFSEEVQVEKVANVEGTSGTNGGDEKVNGNVPIVFPGAKIGDSLDASSKSSKFYLPGNVHSEDNGTRTLETQAEITKLSQTLSSTSRGSIFRLNRRRTSPTSITQMNSLLLQSMVSSYSARSRWSSARDRELLSAKLRIQNAPVVRNAPGLHASAFRNVSVFKRSYELMERMLRVYIYKEGEKPVFHQPKMRGIYASEGWFMKLIEGNKKFIVRDPRKAQLFYLPFSSQMLRNELFGQDFNSQKDLEGYLKKYVDLIAQKYRFWNRTGGADHFLVGCHDWASRLTRQHMGKCIRVLCNSNIARGFKIGKDTTLPVTYIRSVGNPLNDLGGKPPSERPILAFFAGGMHGYLRPILLHHWENKVPDMKIFGPMARDLEGKKMYREYMKSSKYCICARGYEVHTPRVVEAISYECVPVIISDNYVPPFFEVLNWEAFAVFVQEEDIPHLRSILLSIPEERYLEMQLSVKMVQQHFLWHRQPVKYDLFHMVLHSVWYNRVFQISSR